jgi:membrane protease YdiL (CAAX protease family)
VSAATLRSPPALAAAGLLGLGLALVLRVRVAGVDGAHSAAAGVVFGVALLALAAACGFPRPRLGWRQLGWGVGGAAVLCLAPLGHHIAHPGAAAPAGLLPGWAAVVTLVAVAEEVLLRGALWEALVRWRGPYTAIVVTAIVVTAFAFAALHVPVYGWAVVPLDLAVGVFLGVLRVMAGSVTAPTLTHALADLAGWWLR